MRVTRVGIASVFCAIAILLASAAVSGAQTSATPLAEQTAQLDSARAILDQTEQTLTRGDLSDQTLQNLRAGIDPLPQSLQMVIDGLQPRLSDIRARIAQLGPRPAPDAPPESPEIAAERDQQQKQYDAIDAIVKRANLIAKQVEQDSDSIAVRRRELFTRALFAQTSSIVDPRLWAAVTREIPRDARASQTVFSDWVDNAASKLDRLSAGLLAGSLLALAFACALAVRIVHRLKLRDISVNDPSPLRMATAAAWGGLVDSATPIVAALAVNSLLHALDLVGPRVEPLAVAAVEAIIRIALAVAIGHAICAPGAANWRRLAISDASASRLGKLVIAVAAVASASKTIEAWLDIIGAGLHTIIALRGCGAVAAAVFTGFALRDVSTWSLEDECLPPRTGSPDWRGPARAVAWAAVATVIGAALSGYNAFASFLVDQALWVVFVGAFLFLLRDLGEQSIASAVDERAAANRRIKSIVGLRGDSLAQLAVLASGALTVAIALAALLLTLAPWGVESDDMLGGVRAAFFGFKIGEVTISLSSIAISLAIFGVVWALARGLQNWLEAKFLPKTRLDSGLRNSLSTSVGYIGVLSGIALSLGNLGLNFEKLALVAGALSVGIGLGLQSIVNNFVSGLILLWERAIRVGDWVVVGDEQGYVRRINVRSTEIETFDRAMMIVPNSNLMSGVVKNWVRNGNVGRIKISIAVMASVDPDRVRTVLLESAAAPELVMKTPSPQALFVAIADNALKFDLVCFVSDVESSMRVRSELNFEILKRLRAAQIDLFSPPTQVAPIDIDRIETALTRTAPKES